MTDYLAKLSTIGSPPLLEPPRAQPAVFSGYGFGGMELFAWLCEKNGFYAFESALHVFPIGQRPGVIDLEYWNSPLLWKECYGDLADGCLFFGEDIFGDQFALTINGVHRFEAETGDKTRLAATLQEWAEVILTDYEFHTSYRIAHEWQLLNGPLHPGKRLAPKLPFVTGGEYSVENLYEADSVSGMRLRGDVALQIRTFPTEPSYASRLNNSRPRGSLSSQATSQLSPQLFPPSRQPFRKKLPTISQFMPYNVIKESERSLIGELDRPSVESMAPMAGLRAMRVQLVLNQSLSYAGKN